MTAHTLITSRPMPTPRAASFDELQTRMVAAETARRDGRERSLVVVPSRSVEKWHEPAAVTQALEERLLCSLLELRDPGVRLTYVTSSPIAPPIVDYYLSLLPRRMRAHARARLTLVALGAVAPGPLSGRLLARPASLDRIRRAQRGFNPCHLEPYATTVVERDLALALGIPMYGADPRHARFGTKSGCRELFARTGVPHPAGADGISSVPQLIAAIARLRRANPRLTRVVVKLDEGVSGEGNALVELDGLPAPGAPDEADRLAERVDSLAPEAPGVTARMYLDKLAARGGIVEQWITGRDLRSPSVQLQITPFGEVHVVSTHDQILGGPSGQKYLGCRFPAAPACAPAISALARRIGGHLAAAGVIGRLAIDFVVARDERGRWQPYAIELNLRKGGTTHPFDTLAHLTGGTYDADRSTFTTPTGREKHYVATDHFEEPALRALGRDGLLALVRRDGLRFDPMARTGAVFHMLSSLNEIGRTGFTAIADSAEEADALYEHVQSTVRARAHDLEAHACIPASFGSSSAAEA
ncbi:MAG TPA: peptide ligase PGM1-related protein [Solirubrobacteraceae bacterium]|nr:peptide ligase PGM1-related protein [Solirubrobacteraceae bacterium]